MIAALEKMNLQEKAGLEGGYGAVGGSRQREESGYKGVRGLEVNEQREYGVRNGLGTDVGVGGEEELR